MKNVSGLFETYLMVLVHPFRIHQQFRFNIPIPHQDGHIYEPLTLAESLGISWIFAIVKGLGKILILKFFITSLLSMQGSEFSLLIELIQNSGVSAYYFLLFSAALDIIFFPMLSIVLTELWAWIIKLYAGWLNPDLPKDIIADQITTHALSSNLFNVIPFIGDFIQTIIYHFLIYAGLRSNLGTSRSLAFVILLTPLMATLMFVSLILVTLFYLIT
jgi:hypothetical protein